MVALMAGLFSNFQEICSFKEESAKHRIAKLRFLSFFREISCVVTAAPKCRKIPSDFITRKRLEFDKILEQSPEIPQIVALQFKSKFNHLAIHKPDVVIGLQTILPYGKTLVVASYQRVLPPRDKITLLTHFCAWRELSIPEMEHKYDGADVLVEVTNSRESHVGSITVEDNSVVCPERNRQYLLLHGILSEQKRLIDGQNIKIQRNPLSNG